MPLIMRKGSLVNVLLPTMRNTLFRKSSTPHKGSTSSFSMESAFKEMAIALIVKSRSSRSWPSVGARKEAKSKSGLLLSALKTTLLCLRSLSSQNQLPLICLAKLFASSVGSSGKTMSTSLIGRSSRASRIAPPTIYALLFIHNEASLLT